MTNKEAYEILEKSIKCINVDCPPVNCDECPYSAKDEQFDEVFQMAPKALQAQEEKDNCSEEPNNSEQKRVFKRLVRNKEAYYSIIWEEDGEENEGYSSYNLDVISDFLKEHFLQEPKQSDHIAEVGKKDIPSVQPEIIRCKECIYYDSPHVENNGERIEYSEMPEDAFDVLGVGLVSSEYGINIGGRCLRDYNVGYSEDKRVFVSETNYCGRAERRTNE